MVPSPCEPRREPKSIVDVMLSLNRFLNVYQSFDKCSVNVIFKEKSVEADR